MRHSGSQGNRHVSPSLWSLVSGTNRVSAQPPRVGGPPTDPEREGARDPHATARRNVAAWTVWFGLPGGRTSSEWYLPLLGRSLRQAGTCMVQSARRADDLKWYLPARWTDVPERYLLLPGVFPSGTCLCLDVRTCGTSLRPAGGGRSPRHAGVAWSQPAFPQEGERSIGTCLPRWTDVPEWYLFSAWNVPE